jgi:cytochrome o ubiquinol oxidase operon protein cyoD
MIDAHHGWNASFKPQFIAFILSTALTVGAYLIVTHEHLSDGLLRLTIFGSAIAQALIQLVFSLHVGMESKPHWNTITFLFVVMVIIIVIGGSLWIMDNLDYNLMPSMDQEQHMHMQHEY